MIGTWQQLGAMRYALLRVWSEYRDSLHGEVLWTGDTGAMWVVCRNRKYEGITTTVAAGCNRQALVLATDVHGTRTWMRELAVERMALELIADRWAAGPPDVAGARRELLAVLRVRASRLTLIEEWRKY